MRFFYICSKLPNKALQPTRLLRPRAAELERWAVDRRRVDDLEIATCRSGGFED